MSVFDPILQGLLGGHTNAGPMQGILGSILGGGSAPTSGILGNLLGGGQAPQQPQPQQAYSQQAYGAGNSGSGGMGGLMGLIDRFRGAGMGNVADSWVGSGPNQPVSPQQLTQVFGQDQVNNWAQHSGMPTHDFLGQLGHFLPQAVDRATPNGRIEDPVGAMGGSSAFDGPGMAPPGRR